MHEILDDMELAEDFKKLVSTNKWRDRKRTLDKQRLLRLRQEEAKIVADINRRWGGGNA
jgi:hypothetical protein